PIVAGGPRSRAADWRAARTPAGEYEEVRTEKYAARLWPNGRLAGYVTKRAEDGRKRLLPLLFAEITFANGRGARAPLLPSQLPDDRWVGSWDSRRGAGYLLVLPRRSDRHEIRFEIARKEPWPKPDGDHR